MVEISGLMDFLCAEIKLVIFRHYNYCLVIIR